MVKAYESKARSINKDMSNEVVDGVRPVVKLTPRRRARTSPLYRLYNLALFFRF